MKIGIHRVWRAICDKQQPGRSIRLLLLAVGMGSGSFDGAAATWSYLDNGTVKIGVDTDRGACVGWFSPASGANLLNNYDTGRFVQQSYYGDTDGSYWNTTPWRYNPVQGGGWQNNPALLLNFTNSNGRIYAKTRPRHWATGALLPEVVMEEWISLKDSVAHVHYKMSYTGSSQVYFGDQEMPAVFVDYGLTDLVFYGGTHPWQNDTLTSVTVAGVNPPVGVVYDRSEHWAAYVHPVNRGGIGVYTPETVRMTSYRYNSGVGGTGPTSPNCSYFAPLRRFTLSAGCVVEYDLFMTTGTETDIRNNFYNIHVNGFDADNDGIDDVWEYENFGSIDSATATSDYDADHVKDRDEFQAGTNPKSAADKLRGQFQPDGSLTWSGGWGRRYQLQQTSDLAAPGWFGVHLNYSGNPLLNTFVPSYAGARQFFRITARKDAAAQTPGWQFNHFTPGIAWRPNNMTSLEVTNGVLRGVFSANNNNIVTDPNIPLLLDAASYPRLSIRIKNQSASNKLAVRFRRDTDSSTWDNIRLVNASVSTQDTEFKTYELDMSANTNWNGTIIQLRFNVPTSAAAPGGSFDMDYAMFTKSPKVVFSDGFSTDDGSWLGDGALTVAGGAASSSAAGDQSFLKYFTAQTLAVGDAIELKWEMKVSAFSTGASLGRFGFINSRGSKITGDTAYTDPALNNDTGYGIWASDLRDATAPYADYSFLKRTGANDVLVATGAYTVLGAAANAIVTLGNNAWTPVQTLRLTRTATGWQVYTELGGLENNGTYPAAIQTASIADATPETTFDGVFLWFNSTATGETSSVRNVTLTVIPGS